MWGVSGNGSQRQGQPSVADELSVWGPSSLSSRKLPTTNQPSNQLTNPPCFQSCMRAVAHGHDPREDKLFQLHRYLTTDDSLSTGQRVPKTSTGGCLTHSWVTSWVKFPATYVVFVGYYKSGAQRSMRSALTPLLLSQTLPSPDNQSSIQQHLEGVDIVCAKDAE